MAIRPLLLFAAAQFSTVKLSEMNDSCIICSHFYYGKKVTIQARVKYYGININPDCFAF